MSNLNIQAPGIPLWPSFALSATNHVRLPPAGTPTTAHNTAHPPLTDRFSPACGCDQVARLAPRPASHRPPELNRFLSPYFSTKVRPLSRSILQNHPPHNTFPPPFARFHVFLNVLNPPDSRSRSIRALALFTLNSTTFTKKKNSSFFFAARPLSIAVGRSTPSSPPSRTHFPKVTQIPPSLCPSKISRLSVRFIHAGFIVLFVCQRRVYSGPVCPTPPAVRIRW